MTNEQLTHTDPRSTFAQATITARAVVDAIGADQLDLPTPCPDHDVRSMLGHMLIVFRRITALGNGTDPMDMPDAITGVADDAWPTEFLDAAHAVQAAWSDPTKLQKKMVLPWVTAPGAAMMLSYTAELTVHTWDLAVATGQTVAWHEPTVQIAFDTALRALPSGDREAHFAEMAKDMPAIAGRPPFKNAVPVDESASPLEQLIGWYGRQPAPSAV
jgi:uncharacterized protein (TIGR03086 family)